MNVLIVGSGGREHALAWKVAQDASVDTVFVAPGNAGTAVEAKIQNIDIDPLAIEQLIIFCKSNQVALTIVGPEAPLVAGIVDQFEAAGLACFGPSAKAAQLEGSKSYSKAFMQRHNIPTSKYQQFTDIDAALAYLETSEFPLVVKADGLAAGKGVIIAQDIAQARLAVRDILQDNKFGDAGSSLVIEAFLHGEEVSFICMVGRDGAIMPMATSQDHKAAFDKDQGPNTGGMGAYSPAPLVDAELHARIMQEVIEPTVSGMEKDGVPYSGFLYAGLMIAADGTPNVLEYNCRFGDPETQPIMLRLQSDLAKLCLAALEGQLGKSEIQWDSRAAVGVVLAAKGYPDSYEKGAVITGLDTVVDEKTKVFHAGTKLQDGHIVTSGGRVLCVAALGDTVEMAQQKAYAQVQHINWQGMWCRTDIGYRAILRETQTANT